MPLLVNIFIVILIWIPMCVHQHLWNVQELLPKCYRCCPAWWYRVLLLHFFCSFIHLLEVPLHKLTFPLIMNRDVHLVVYLPTPSVVVHRTHCQVLTVKKIHFRMKHSLCCLIHWNLVTNESLEKHVIKDTFEDRLISFTCCQYCGWYSLFNCIYKLSVKF